MRWTGERLEDLLLMTIPELLKKYPSQNEANLIRRRQEVVKRIREGQMEIPKGAEKRLASTWEVAAYDREKGDWVTKELSSYRYEDDSDESHLPQIEASRITPTRRKIAKRAYKLILAYGDGQVDYRRLIDPQTDDMKIMPIHDEAAHRVIQQINAEYQPETTVNLGDFADMAALSRFDASSDHFHKTLGLSMRYIHDFYAQMRADNPKGHHVEVDSNHAARPKRQVLKNIPALYDFVRPGDDKPYPMMTYFHMANLGKLDIDFISGYGAAQFVYGRESGNPIAFKHGTHSSSAPGATVRKESMENPNVNIVRGHGHKDEEVRTTREMPDGTRRQLFYKQLGSTCLNNGMVEGYSSSVDDFNQPVETTLNHQTTIALIEDYGGRYNVNTIEIVDGVAYYQGKVFNGNLDVSQGA